MKAPASNRFWLSVKLKTLVELLCMNAESSTEQIMEKLELVRIRQALRATRGHQRAAASLIGLSEPTFSRRVARYGIDVSEFQP